MIQDIEVTVDGITYDCYLEGSAVDSISEIRMINRHTKEYHAQANIDHNMEHITVTPFEGEETTANYYEFNDKPKELCEWMGSVC
jgi:hypothetical protein